MKIYSYKTPEVEETLDVHVLTALDLIKKKSKIVRYGAKIEPKFYDILRVAVIFHDIGKAFYQANYKEKDMKRVLSFRGHEVISAYIFHNILKKLKQEVGVEEYRIYDPATFSILYHHHAMGIDKRISTIIKIKEPEELGKILQVTSSIIDNILQKNELEEFRKALVNTVMELIEKVQEVGFRKLLEIIAGNVKQLKSSLWRKDYGYATSKKFRKVALLLLSALITVDYIAAIKIRGGSQTIFAQAINEYYAIYFMNNF